MNRTQPLSDEDLHGYIDDRLDAAGRARVRAALEADPALAEKAAQMRADREALRAAFAPIHDEPVPGHLRPAAPAAPDWRRLAAGAVLFALGIGAGWGAARWEGPQTAPARAPLNELVSEAQVAHAVYSVEVAHPVEVAADQQTHLMAWLSKRLGHPLSAPDLSGQGYTLVGGRLLPSDKGPAAQLMYENAGGLRVTLYVTALDSGETAFRLEQGKNGVSSLIWVDQGYGFALSAPLTRNRLWPLGQSVYRQVAFAG
ncbi:anti-sigma factor family protein [Thioclava atlantica]|uniref:Anti-sigma factor transmembrane transcriptional regulator n=1 Tax=Thioclava atlantica TaxID=1317124 RepID=A0A085TZU8_9RHOB|nr:anti-sigma factor [Thioclava atlantica]KFE36245.1 anti-sigma factor transmembrane transcriptional regulator [Thioclava atlantica]